jgi:hypothetical protein
MVGNGYHVKGNMVYSLCRDIVYSIMLTDMKFTLNSVIARGLSPAAIQSIWFFWIASSFTSCNDD